MMTMAVVVVVGGGGGGGSDDNDKIMKEGERNERSSERSRAKLSMR